ncbi:hypothetical protein Acsp03_11350 [Actinomadura sp. NBRC 104412]|uniref:hypothetical protein n=1 Tax=Actinomadura sp. NBRC 104412 TaxID=3032203 RepID=UPI0024A4D461|nr:hypothetical protein [Actinomadura sp. NBRC 104412]GLZ03668.1 hypothetical protein Acsp03_11350 [Actinomadura sp. NBRC 104412]
MWPGFELPVGPPPSSEPPRIRPGAGWFALPAVLLAIAVIVVVAVVAVTWDEAQAADGPRASGDAREGIQIVVTGGYNYFIFVRDGDPPPTSCTVAYPNEDPGPVELTKENSWAATPPPGYRWAASFTATLSGRPELTCEGTAGTVRIVPDDTSYGYMGLGLIVGIFLGCAALIAFVVILLMRRNSARDPGAAMAGTPGPHESWPY